MKPANLGEFEQALLFALLHLDGMAHGGAIQQEIERRTGRSVSPGAVYTAMDRMEGRGFVRSSLAEGGPARGGRRRKLYRLLPAGASALEASWDRLRRMAEGAFPGDGLAREEG